MSKQLFDILYSKDLLKKKKIYYDGNLLLQRKGITLFILLSDENNKELLKRTLTEEQEKEIKIGNEITIGNYLIQIEKEKNCNIKIQKNEEINEIETLKTPPQVKKVINPILTKSMTRTSLNSRGTINSNTTGPLPLSRELDQSLMRVMRAHQVCSILFYLMNLFID